MTESKACENITPDNIINNNQITLKYINDRINREICDDTIDKLKDVILIPEYKKCKSVKNSINTLTTILKRHSISDDTAGLVIDDYLIELIPPGTKGVIRGNIFNSIVKDIIDGMKLDNQVFDVRFEAHCDTCATDEKPDWYILEKSTGKVIIGMNQLDLWNGGQQLNRGYKYLVDNKINTDKSKLLCVVCNKIIFGSEKTKSYRLFQIGFMNDTLCYIKNITNIINKFFSI